MRILYMTHFDVNDMNACSGTIFHIKQMLEKTGNEVIVLDQLEINKVFKYLKKIIAKINNKQTLIEREPYILKKFAKQIKKKVKNLEYDIIFSPSSLYFTYYEDEKPMVFYTDACFGGMVDYYIYRNNYSKKAIKNGYKQEKLALKNTDLAIYTSEWAKDTAVKYHDADDNKCRVVNRGANVKHSYKRDEIISIIKRRNIGSKSKQCSFMFLGKDWNRKGGPIACEIIKILNKKYGVEATLNVIGCNPVLENEYKQYVNVIGFLDKHNPLHYNRLEEIFKESDFFLLPSRQEAQGISYAEACSWGLPVIATNTGGVADIIEHKVNGLLFEVDDNPEKYASNIIEYINDRDKYLKLGKSTYDYFESNLTWTSVGNKINEILELQVRGERE